jgi:outer membrane protein
MVTPDRRRAARASRRSAALAAALAILSPAGAGRAESLQDALTAAYGDNPTLLAERAQLEGTNEGVPQALANWRPTILATETGGKTRTRNVQDCSFEGSQNRPQFTPCGVFQSTGSQVSVEKLYQSTADASIKQPLYRGGQTIAATAEALHLVDAERANLANVEASVLLTVVTDYLGVVEQAVLLDLNRENEEILRKQVAATDDRYRFGELTHTDLYLAEASYAEAIAGRKTQEGQLLVARAAYQHDVGHPPADLAMPDAVPDLPLTRTEAAGTAAVAAPAVVQAQYVQKAAEDDIKRIRGQLLPQVAATADFNRTSDITTYGLKVQIKSATAEGTLQVYDGGAVYAQSRAGQKLVEQRKHQLDDARRHAVQAAQQAWDKLKSDRDQLVDLRHSVEVNQRAVDGLQEEARVGTRTIQDVLIQQQALFQARINLTTALHDEKLDGFTLAAAIGRLNARSLGLPVALYDPALEFAVVRDKWVGFGTEP